MVKDREVAEQILSLIINDGGHYTSEKTAFVPLQGKDTVSTEKIYTLQTLNQQRKIEAARLKVEQAKLLPSISLGYNTATIQGTGADNKIYDANKRFHSVVVGVSIPIFNGAQRSVIRSQKINQQIADQQYQSAVIDLQKKITEYQKKYEKYKYEVNYYQTSGLNNATTLIETAQLQLEQGQINYLEWSMLVQQALEIKNQYLEAIKNLNEQTIELNALYQQL